MGFSVYKHNGLQSSEHTCMAAQKCRPNGRVLPQPRPKPVSRVRSFRAAAAETRRHAGRDAPSHHRPQAAHQRRSRARNAPPRAPAGRRGFETTRSDTPRWWRACG